MLKADDRYKPKQDIRVIGMTAWGAPFTGGHDVILPKGVEFKILSNPRQEATAVYCEIIDYAKWEKIFVPEEDRKNKKYSNYYICIDIEEIKNNCEKI